MICKLNIAIILCLLATRALHSQDSYQITFPSIEYSSNVGTAFAAPIIVTPVPPSGLFSYGIIVEVTGTGGLMGLANVTPSDSLNFDGVKGANSQNSNDLGLARLKGSVDVFSSEKSNYVESHIATLNLIGLPTGEYQLKLLPYVTLGDTESLFVDGTNTTIDPFMIFGSARLIISEAIANAEVAADGNPRTDRQTGFVLRDYVVTNTGSTTSAFRIWVHDLASNWQVWNRHGQVDDIPYVDLSPLIAPGVGLRFTLEFYANPTGGIPNPTLTASPITVSTPGIQGRNLPLAIRGVVTGGALLEFNSEAGKLYTIQYTDNLTNWNTILPKIEGTGNKMQWLDNGPPKTASPPLNTKRRFYRMQIE